MPRWEGREADLGHLEALHAEFTAYLRSRGIKERSLKQYRFAVGELAKTGEQPADLTAQDLINLEADMRQRLKPGTVKNRKAQIASFLMWAVYGVRARKGQYPDSVLDAWKVETNHKPRAEEGDGMAPPKTLVTFDDLKALLTVVATVDPAHEIRNRALFALLWDSGARAGEIVAVRGVSEGLKIGQVTVKGDHAELALEGKTGRRTNVPIVFSVPYLKRWLNVHPDGGNPDAPLWPTEKGTQLEYKFLHALLKRMVDAARRAGYMLPADISPHSMRHGRAQYAKTVEGLGDEQMRALFGWNPGSRMTSRYGGMADASRTILAHWTGQTEKPQGAELQLCPHCQAEVTLGVNWCPACGGAISEAAKKMAADRAEQASRLTQLEAQMSDLRDLRAFLHNLGASATGVVQGASGRILTAQFPVDSQGSREAEKANVRGRNKEAKA